MERSSIQTPKDQATSQFLADRHTLLGFIRSLVRDGHAAEDIFQETWLRLAAKIDSGEDIELQGAWCRKTAKYLVLHYWRANHRSKVAIDSTLVEAFLDRVEQAFEEGKSDSDMLSARQHALTECVLQLPERSRTLLQLRYDQGLTIDVIATRLKAKADTVVKSLYRLRGSLNKCIEQRLRSQRFSS
jgi:RNA polymerase sigma-70 factor, ECF subfamily